MEPSDEVDKAIGHLKKKNAPGIGNITPEILEDMKDGGDGKKS